MQKIFLASSPGCVKGHAEKQERFISGIKANRMFSFWTLTNQKLERKRFKISCKGKKQ